MIILKSAQELDVIAHAGQILRGCLDMLAESVEPGISTRELDRLAEEYIRTSGGVPTFKGYRGFPGSICVSPNDMVVHGIPGATRLRDGDIVGIDVGVTYQDFIADAAVTVPVGVISAEARALMTATEESLMLAVEQCRPGHRVGDISHTVQSHVEARGYSVVRSLVGHGVGRDMHEEPQVPNFGRPGRGPRLSEGMVLAIEPMVNIGGYEVEVGSDTWSIFTKDGSLSAHFEHTVAVTADGPRLLTV